MEPTGKYIIEEQNAEIHMFGNYLGVRWNLKTEYKQVTLEDGANTMARVSVRDGKPYIYFGLIKTYSNRGVGIADDLSVEGGISEKEARTIAVDLVNAADYLKSLTDWIPIYNKIGIKTK